MRNCPQITHEQFVNQDYRIYQHIRMHKGEKQKKERIITRLSNHRIIKQC